MPLQPARRDGQAEARALVRPHAAIVDLAKLLEYEPKGGGRNADTGIRHSQQELSVLNGRLDPDLPLLGEFHCVAQEVDQDLPQFVLVGEERNLPVFNVFNEPDAVAPEQGFDGFQAEIEKRLKEIPKDKAIITA